MSALILYTSHDGRARVQLRPLDGGVWLSQLEIAELFETTKQNVSLHIRNILKDRELAEDSVVKQSLTTASDGKNYPTQLHRLEMIKNVDRLLEFNDRPLLKDNGSVSAEQMKTSAQNRYDSFDARRHDAELANAEAEAEDLRVLEEVEQQVKKRVNKIGPTQ